MNELRQNDRDVSVNVIKIMEGVKKILVIDFGGIGDLVLSIPFLRGLKASFPSSNVSILCAERAGRILKDQPYINNLLLSPIELFSLIKISLSLRKRRFDIAINLMPETSFPSAIKMYLLFLLINARLWVGRDTEGRGFFYNIKISEEKMQVENEILLYGRILRAIDGMEYDERLEFNISEENRKLASRFLLQERRFPESPLVLINPGSDRLSRRWPIEQYGELLNRLKETFPSIEFGIIGTKEELELAEFLKEKGGEKVFVLSGKTPLEMLPAILEKAALLVTNDSGPSHIARAIGIPTVILVGPGEPAYFKVKGRAESVVIYHPVPCAPCLKDLCDEMDCWKAISVEEVFDETSKILKRMTYGINS